jgi:aryl-alcohol dehydrogenase-like predicted oxidoreductase
VNSFSRLGLGVTGPHATALVRADATMRLVRTAIDLGVTTFDTGPMYGDGEAERRLGRALKGIPRDKVFVITKARTWAQDDAAPDIGASLRASLARLGLDHVDALLMHGPLPQDMTRLSESGALAALRDQGLALRLGVCGRGGERDAMIAARTAGAPFDFLMTPVTGEDALLERAAAAGVDIIAIETMRARRRFRTPRALADFWYLARDARDAAAGKPPPEGVGVAGALALPAVTCAVVTTTRPAHLQDNARAAGLTPPRG